MASARRQPRPSHPRRKRKPLRLPAYAITLPPAHAAAAVWLGRDVTIRRWRPQQLGVGDWLALHAGRSGGLRDQLSALQELGEEAVWAGRFTGWSVGRYTPDPSLYRRECSWSQNLPRVLHLTLWGRGDSALDEQPETCSFSKGRALPQPPKTPKPPEDIGGWWPGSWPIYSRAIVGIARIGSIEEGSSCSPWDQGTPTDAASSAGARPAARSPQRTLFDTDTDTSRASSERGWSRDGRWVLRFDRICRLHTPLGSIPGHPRYWPLPKAYRKRFESVEVER